jgi:hypothetical protein
MRSKARWPLVLAIVLMAVGVVGLVAGAVVLEAGRRASVGAGAGTGRGGMMRRGGGASGGTGGYSSNGERIYYTGIGHAGAITVDWNPAAGFGGMMGGRGRMGGMGCVRCHGRDGRGGSIRMMGAAVDVPDIRYDALTHPRREGTETVSAWTEPQIEDAVRKGVEPTGETLDRFMPRWEMDATDMKDTIAYLKELSSR